MRGSTVKSACRNLHFPCVEKVASHLANPILVSLVSVEKVQSFSLKLPNKEIMACLRLAIVSEVGSRVRDWLIKRIS